MSSNILTSNKFDKYIPLFGRSNDRRVRLFLHNLEKIAAINRKARGGEILLLKDVRFINGDLDFDNTHTDVKDMILSDIKMNNPPNPVDNPSIEQANDTFYNHANIEFENTHTNMISIQPEVTDITLVGNQKLPEWTYAISSNPIKSEPFINNENWNTKDNHNVDYESIRSTEMNIHSEWIIFFGQFIIRISEKNDSTFKYKEEVLTILNELSGTKENNSTEHFMQYVVQLLFKNLNSSSTTLHDVSLWSNITKFNYNNINNLFYKFHLYNFIVRLNNNNSISWFQNDNSKYLSITNCLNAALGIPLYQLTQPEHNKPYHILYGNNMYKYPQYNYDMKFIDLIKNDDSVILSEFIFNFITYQYTYLLVILRMIIDKHTVESHGAGAGGVAHTMNICSFINLLNTEYAHLLLTLQNDHKTYAAPLNLNVYLLNYININNYNINMPDKHEFYNYINNPNSINNNSVLNNNFIKELYYYNADLNAAAVGARIDTNNDIHSFKHDHGIVAASVNEANLEYIYLNNLKFIYINPPCEFNYLIIICYLIALKFLINTFNEYATKAAYTAAPRVETYLIENNHVTFLAYNAIITEIRTSVTHTAGLNDNGTIPLLFNTIINVNYYDNLLVYINKINVYNYMKKLYIIYNNINNFIKINGTKKLNDYNLSINSINYSTTNPSSITDNMYKIHDIKSYNIINCLHNIGIISNSYLYQPCYNSKTNNDNILNYEKYFTTHKQAILVVYNILNKIKGDKKVNNIYKKNIDLFIEWSKDFFNRDLQIKTHDLSTLDDKYNDINIYKVQDYDDYNIYFTQKLLPEILNTFNDIDNIETFNYKFDKYFDKLLYEIEIDNDDIVPVINTRDPLDIFNTIDPSLNEYKNIFFRKSDGKLYKKNSNGDIIAIHSGSEEYKKIKFDNKCRTTSVKITNDLKCHEFFSDCLQGTNLKKCKKFLSAHDFWEIAENEYDNIHPKEAIRILNAFKFNIINKFDKNLNISLKFFESYDSWLLHLQKMTKLSDTDSNKLSDAEYDQIVSNSRLTYYLKQLINKINQNPAILNINFIDDGKYVDSQPVPITRAGRYGVFQGKINKIEILDDNIKNNMVSSSSKSGTYDINQIFKDLRGLQYLFNSINTNKISNFYSSKIMSGGDARLVLNTSIGSHNLPSITKISDFNLLKQNMKQNTYKSSHIIEKLYNDIISKLKIIHKDVSPDDNHKILNHINDLKDKEEKIYKMVNYIDKYIELYKIYGDNQNGSTLNLDNVAKYINKYENVSYKTNDKRNSILSILETIANIVVDKIKMEIKPEPEIETTSKTELTKSKVNLQALFN